MKTLFFLFPIFIFTIFGCSTLYIIKPENPKETRLINELSKEYKSTVTLVNGKKNSSKNILITPDSTTWADALLNINNSVKTNKVYSVEIIKRWKGTWQGLGIGVLAGALGGAIIGFASGDDPPGWFSFFASEKALLNGFAFGVLGGLVGMSIGAVIGNENIYLISHDYKRKK